MIILLVVLFIVFLMVNAERKKEEQHNKMMEEAAAKGLAKRQYRENVQLLHNELLRLKPKFQNCEHPHEKVAYRFLDNNDCEEEFITVSTKKTVLLRDEIFQMGWREFEIYITDLLNRAGYNAETTPAQKDEGRDVVAIYNGITYFVECKHWVKGNFMISRDLLQKLIGSGAPYGVTNFIFISLAKYSDNSREYANKINQTGVNKISLWGINDILNIERNLGTSLEKEVEILERKYKGASASKRHRKMDENVRCYPHGDLHKYSFLVKKVDTDIAYRQRALYIAERLYYLGCLPKDVSQYISKGIFDVSKTNNVTLYGNNYYTFKEFHPDIQCVSSPAYLYCPYCGYDGMRHWYKVVNKSRLWYWSCCNCGEYFEDYQGNPVINPDE